MRASVRDVVSGFSVVSRPPSTGNLNTHPFVDGSWNTDNGAKLLNQKGPDGAALAAAFIENGSTSTHGLYVAVSAITAIQSYTLTLYARSLIGARGLIPYVYSTTYADVAAAYVDLKSGRQAFGTVSVGSFTSVSAVTYKLPNGWVRVMLTFTGKVDTGFNLSIQSLLLPTTPTFAGDGQSSFSLWGVDIR